MTMKQKQAINNLILAVNSDNATAAIITSTSDGSGVNVSAKGRSVDIISGAIELIKIVLGEKYTDDTRNACIDMIKEYISEQEASGWAFKENKHEDENNSDSIVISEVSDDIGSKE